MNLSFPSTSRMLLGSLFTGVVACVVGCSEESIERVPVSGQVLLDGKPLQYGTIRVEPSGARMAASKLDSEGRFSLMTYAPGDGAPLGTHSVAVNGAEQLGPYSVKWHAPPKYAEASKSGLQMQIVEETDDVVIEITWDGAEPFVQKFASDQEAEKL